MASKGWNLKQAEVHLPMVPVLRYYIHTTTTSFCHLFFHYKCHLSGPSLSYLLHKTLQCPLSLHALLPPMSLAQGGQTTPSWVPLCSWLSLLKHLHSVCLHAHQILWTACRQPAICWLSPFYWKTDSIVEFFANLQKSTYTSIFCWCSIR